jgi:hypothetical protein
MFALAQLISFFTNPFFIALPIPFLLVYHETNDTLLSFKWMVFSMLFIVMIGMFVLYEVRRHVFTDIDVSHREQRPIFFAFVTFIALLYLFSLFILHGPLGLYVAVGGILGGLLVLALVNQRIKASIHVASISSFFTVLAILYGGISMLWLLVIPIVAWSRIKTKRHTVSEAVVGCFLGIMLTLLVYAGVEIWH